MVPACAQTEGTALCTVRSGHVQPFPGTGSEKIQSGTRTPWIPFSNRPGKERHVLIRARQSITRSVRVLGMAFIGCSCGRVGRERGGAGSASTALVGCAGLVARRARAARVWPPGSSCKEARPDAKCWRAPARPVRKMRRAPAHPVGRMRRAPAHPVRNDAARSCAPSREDAARLLRARSGTMRRAPARPVWEGHSHLPLRLRLRRFPLHRLLPLLLAAGLHAQELPLLSLGDQHDVVAAARAARGLLEATEGGDDFPGQPLPDAAAGQLLRVSLRHRLDLAAGVELHHRGANGRVPLKAAASMRTQSACRRRACPQAENG
eukprot:gene3913-biopygen6159